MLFRQATPLYECTVGLIQRAMRLTLNWRCERKQRLELSGSIHEEVTPVENTCPIYLHLLVFQCPQCGDPISIPKLSEVRSLEQADGSTYMLTCSCGYAREALGIQARHHCVELWRPFSEHDAPNPGGLKSSPVDPKVPVIRRKGAQPD